MNADDPLLTRQTLLRRVRGPRDQAAWEEFAGYYRGYIHNIACRMGLNHHDAQEIGQNVMLQLWKKLPDFEYDVQKGRFRGWLCTVTSNEVRMLLRGRARDPAGLSAEERENLGKALENTQVDPGEEFAEREWIRYVTELAWTRIAEKTGEKERAAFEMVSKGRTVDEVAETLGIAPASVYVYKKRVKDLLTQEVVALNNELD